MSGNTWAGYYRRGVPPAAPVALKPGRASRIAMIAGGLVALSGIAYAIVTGRGAERDQAVAFTHHFAGHVDNTGQCYFEVVANGTRFSMLGDSGASGLTFNRQHLARLGVNPASLRFNHKMTGATGSARAADITLRELRLGDDYVARDVAAEIIDTHGGSEDAPLLGMATLKGMQFTLGGGECSLSWQ
jgi:aspartyl protease family protein